MIAKDFVKKLDTNIVYKQAGTGTVYLQYNDKKIRISNHEPNDSMVRFRGTSELEIYTKDVSGTLIEDKYSILEKVADFFKLEIKGHLKGAFTKHYNKKHQEHIENVKRKEEHKVFLADYATKQKQLHHLIIKTVQGKEKEVKNIIKNAIEYGKLGSDSAKRNKRRRSFFKQEFKKQFGIDVELSDAKEALKID